MSFKNDLAFGQRYENKAVDVIREIYGELIDIKKPQGCFKDYDILATLASGTQIKAEVKASRTAYKYKKILIEITYKQKPSGIITTKSDIWIHYVLYPKRKPDIYVFKTKELFKLLFNGERFNPQGNSECISLTFEQIEPYKHNKQIEPDDITSLISQLII